MRACGYANPKAFAYGRRTIAGTIILTQFWMDALLRFVDLPPEQLQRSGERDWAWIPPDAARSYSKDESYSKIDQLPPLNFTFCFADEYGHASVRKLLGVVLVTDGTVYSVNDQLTEQTISYMAMDFTPLQPIEIIGKLRDFPQNNKTPHDVHAETWLAPKGNAPPVQNIKLNVPKPTFGAIPKTKSTSGLVPPFLTGLLNR